MTLKDRLLDCIEEDYDKCWQGHPLLYLLKIPEDLAMIKRGKGFSERLFDQLILSEHEHYAEFELFCLLTHFMSTHLKYPCQEKDVFVSGQCILALIITSEACRSALITGVYSFDKMEIHPIQVDLLTDMLNYFRHLIEKHMEEVFDENTEHLIALFFRIFSELTFQEAHIQWKSIYSSFLNEEIFYRMMDQLRYRPSMIDLIVLICRLSECKMSSLNFL